jgi:putative hydroxymethylpyrimidine transporter CytX
VSIAEIFTGTLVAPLGFWNGLFSIVIGHLIGCTLLYFAGYIGAKTEKSAMETVKMSFGKSGAILFSVLNVLQLIGWTAIMIIQGGRATGLIANSLLGTSGNGIWCIFIGILIIIWILVGVKNLDKLNTVTMSTLFLLTLVLSGVVFKGANLTGFLGGISFGQAVELSAAMPLSWLPLISDYTKHAKSPKAASIASAVTYFFTSCWMYIIGMAAALFTGSSDIAQIMLSAGLVLSE